MTPEDHSGGPVRCEQLGPFVDGELAPDEAAAFRRHLLVCARCQQEMHGLMQLSALAEVAREQRPVPAAELSPAVIAAVTRRAHPRRAAWMAVVGAVAIAAALVLALRVNASRSDLPRLLASLDARTVSGWPSAAGPSQYRPYAVGRGTEQSTPPALARAELKAEEAGDLRALATLALLRRDFARADAVLGRLPVRPDVLADRGLVRMEQGRCEDALEFLDQALEAQPGYLPALFNRGLCLRRLGLPDAAAVSLGKVSEAGAGGWSTEAEADRRTVKERAAAQKAREQAFTEERRKLVEHQDPPPAALVEETPGRVRPRFDEALAAAGTRAELERLLVTARSVDAIAGGNVLEERVRSAIRDVRPARAGLAARFRAWFFSRTAVPVDELGAFVRDAMAAGQHDQALEAFAAFGYRDASELRARLVREARDPFHDVFFAAAVAGEQRGRGETLEAERTVRRVRAHCTIRSLDYPCWYLDQESIEIETLLGRFREAATLAEQSAERMRRLGQLGEERNALLQLADVKLAADRLAAARATWEEIGLRDTANCRVTVYRQERLSAGYVRRRDGRSARAVLDALPQCDSPVEPWRLALRLDVAQLLGDQPRLAKVASSLKIALSTPGTSERDRLQYSFALERTRLELGEAAGAALLLPDGFRDDIEVREAWTRATVARFFSALRRGPVTEAVAALGSVAGGAGTRPCTVAVGRDLTRSGWVALGTSGEPRAGWSTRDDSPSSGLLPAEARAVLAPCQEISVLTTADLQGASDLLPETFAWSFDVAERPASPKPAPGRLLVRDSRPPPELGLPPLRLQGLPGGPGWTVLEGPDATPRRVLDAMARAGFIEFAVHGQIDAEVPDGAMLMLSEDQDRNYALSASALRPASLAGSPLVILGACHAGAGSAMRQEPWSLPRAMVEAGARSVIASRAELPDAEASQFFEGIRHRVESGATPRAALRDERLAWLQKGRVWVREVVAFD
jgi:cellulose synthase operon protein C